MDSTVIPFDLQRMFLGEQPALFYAEILVRTLLIYAYALLMIRWIGGRGVAQLSLVEFVLVIALGSAVGDAMFYPDVPLVVAMAVITGVVLLNKAVNVLVNRSNYAKGTIEGHPIQLVENGRLLMEGLKMSEMAPAEVKASLRQNGIRNLGQVDHAFLESSGAVSVFRLDDPQPGLPLIPPDSVQTPRSRPALLTDTALAPQGKACCSNCGAIQDAGLVIPDGRCGYCNGNSWVAPMTCRTQKDR